MRLVVDIGGTITDIVLVGGADQILATTKTPTTPANPTLGALRGDDTCIGKQCDLSEPGSD
jgi:N-methylhydantoinase A